MDRTITGTLIELRDRIDQRVREIDNKLIFTDTVSEFTHLLGLRSGLCDASVIVGQTLSTILGELSVWHKDCHCKAERQDDCTCGITWPEECRSNE